MEAVSKIFNKHCTLVSKDYNEYIILNKEAFIKDLESLHPCEEKKMSDEEIERWAIESFAHLGNYEVNIAFGAAKAMRDGKI